MLWRWERVRVLETPHQHPHEAERMPVFMDVIRVPTTLGAVLGIGYQTRTFCRRVLESWKPAVWYSVDEGYLASPGELEDLYRAHLLQKEMADYQPVTR